MENNICNGFVNTGYVFAHCNNKLKYKSCRCECLSHPEAQGAKYISPFGLPAFMEGEKEFKLGENNE